MRSKFEVSRNPPPSAPALTSSRWNPAPEPLSQTPPARRTISDSDCEGLLNDAALLERIGQRDESAARELVERLRPTILKCIRRRLPRWAGEEDLMQTVFAKIFANLHQFS